MNEFGLRRGLDDVRRWAARYPAEYDAPLERIVDGVRSAGYLTAEQLQLVCRWKSARTKGRVAKNVSDDVAEITRVMLTTSSERLRIEVPILLQGVGYPSASVLLHWFHRDRYPILDFRALWSLGVTQVLDYSFGLWWEYVTACRALAEEHQVDMRTLDRALWQFSKEKQRR